MLVSLDGFRWDYCERFPAETANLRALRREGVTRRVRLVRTIDYLTTSDVERVPAAALAELERSPECVVIDLGAKQ